VTPDVNEKWLTIRRGSLVAASRLNEQSNIGELAALLSMSRGRRITEKGHGGAKRQEGQNKLLFFLAISHVFRGTFGHFGHVFEHPDRGFRQVQKGRKYPKKPHLKVPNIPNPMIPNSEFI